MLTKLNVNRQFIVDSKNLSQQTCLVYYESSRTPTIMIYIYSCIDVYKNKNLLLISQNVINHIHDNFLFLLFAVIYG